MIRTLFTVALAIAIVVLAVNNHTHRLSPVLFVLMFVQAINLTAYWSRRRRS